MGRLASKVIHSAERNPTTKKLSLISIIFLLATAGFAAVDVQKSDDFPATVVGSDRVKQALFDMSVVEPTKETVIEAARQLGCDAVLLPSILGSEAKDYWNVWTEYDTGKVHQSDAK